MPETPERDGFHTGAVTARIMPLAKTSQAKILVVDDDELKLALLCDRKKRPEVELLSRIHAAVSPVNLRVQLREARDKLCDTTQSEA